jgi:ABC-type antimicrobial peptide transport system permease subunit
LFRVLDESWLDVKLDPRRIIGSIFSRALGQLALGAVAGVVIATLLEQITDGELMRGNGGVVLPLVALFMMLVGLLAAFGPARRGLRVHPTEALREQ